MLMAFLNVNILALWNIFPCILLMLSYLFCSIFNKFSITTWPVLYFLEVLNRIFMNVMFQHRALKKFKKCICFLLDQLHTPI